VQNKGALKNCMCSELASRNKMELRQIHYPPSDSIRTILMLEKKPGWIAHQNCREYLLYGIAYHTKPQCPRSMRGNRRCTSETNALYQVLTNIIPLPVACYL
jgi:hypothetical protein